LHQLFVDGNYWQQKRKSKHYNFVQINLLFVVFKFLLVVLQRCTIMMRGSKHKYYVYLRGGRVRKHKLRFQLKIKNFAGMSQLVTPSGLKMEAD
jgi:hypothetical protein